MVRLFFNIWPFATKKIIPNMSQICQTRLSILPKICLRLVNFCRSSEISPNLVTLIHLQNMNATKIQIFSHLLTFRINQKRENVTKWAAEVASLKWPIPRLFFVISIQQWCSWWLIQFANDWIWTTDLWCRKQPLDQSWWVIKFANNWIWTTDL